METWRRGKFTVFVLVQQIVFLILFGVFVEYDWTLDTRYDTTGLVNATADAKQHDLDGNDGPGETHQELYGMFQDVHVMIFIGFGYLMTFLKRYGFSSVGFNLLVAALVIQWATLMSGFLHLTDGKIKVNLLTMFTSDFAAAAVLITFGAVLGKLSPIQYVVLSFFEIIVFQVNEYIGLSKFKVVDVGGSMFVHVFGAYFGLAVSRTMYRKDIKDAEPKNCSIYHSDVFSMIGTVFLWLFWPSFNAALAPGDDQHRAILNTYFCLAACAVTAFAVSAAVHDEDKFDMVHIQNATIAGGVAIGTSADMMIHPWGSILIGMIAATLSVLGYAYSGPMISEKFKIHDTCGVNNLHGMPGILAGIIGAIVVALADEDDYGYSLYNIFPARVPEEGTQEYLELRKHITVVPGDGRSAGIQASYQIAALATTLAFAIVGGILTGIILRLPIWNRPKGEEIHDDEEFWEIPDDGFPDLNPFHIPDSTFANLPHAFKPQMTKDGRMIGQISAVKKPKNQEYKDKVEKDEENNGTTSITKV